VKSGLKATKKKAIEAGCTDYIAKPIKKEQLLELIHSYFDKPN
jgi:CheY-like chemotaxis protein